MIIEADIIYQPKSGEYDEVVYDNPSPWNSQNWTWVKFLNDNYEEWVGQFRGEPRKIAISEQHNKIVVLTADNAFLLDRKDGRQIEVSHQPEYLELTVAPNGDFILANSFNIDRVIDSFKDSKTLISPIEMDLIEFKQWDNNKLQFTCEEFTNWERQLDMILDTESWTIKVNAIQSSRRPRQQ